MSAEGNKVTRLHHIGVTVTDADKAVQEWKDAFGFEGHVVEIPENDMKIGVVKIAGVTFFLNEYLDPERRAQNVNGLTLPVTFSGHRVVNELGEGISHIALETTDIDHMMEKAKAAGLEFRWEEAHDALEGVCNHLVPEDAHMPLEFMQPVEGKENPLE
jgi:catechol 2,3-dioxygenase-like lactoylglutathione lyase family enzyme